ncbi:MAG: tRNA (adenosine(37)-N6)-dimethylallyltransferase MiaA, partial [Pedobacter sp.]|nr:tRNA (adenosine(37)-N6)-dimethylallyltransferase MiaA [Pedobacter sp.]
GMYIHSILQNQQYTAIPSNPEFRATLPIHDIDQLRNKLFLYPAAFTAHADLSSSKRLVRAIEIAEWLSENKLEEKQWPQINPLIIGLTSEVALRREKILNRLDERFDAGLIAEVERLILQGVSTEMLTFYGLEYKFIAAYLNKEHTLPELKEKLFIAICQFAKRQMTFFRKMEKDGVKINWFNTDQNPVKMEKDILKLYALYSSQE